MKDAYWEEIIKKRREQAKKKIEKKFKNKKEKEMVRIRYWYQETAKSGRFVLSGLMSVANAKKLVASNVYERAEIISDREFIN